jgi:hypothetical protein
MFARVDELAGTDRRGMADDGDQVALSARLHPQHAESAVLVVKGDPLDDAGRGSRHRVEAFPPTILATRPPMGNLTISGSAKSDECEE